MNKIYLGNQVIVDLSGYYDITAIDASFGALDASIADAYDSLDNLEDVVTTLDSSLAEVVTTLLTDYYNKAHIDASVAALEQEIQTMGGIDFVVVDTLPTASADTLKKIYLVPSQSATTGNAKDEYVTIDNGQEADPRYTWELIGTTEIDLSNYATKSYVDDAVADTSAYAAGKYADKTAVDTSIAALDTSVTALVDEVKIYGNHTINNLVTCTSTAYDGISTKDPSTLYIVTD